VLKVAVMRGTGRLLALGSLGRSPYCFKHAIGLALSRWGNERGRLIAALSGVG